jgi:hypothetical protein
MKGAEYKWSALNADVYCDHVFRNNSN